MSSANLSRRTSLQIQFDGVDISSEISKNLISLTYTDNEEGEADDLQILLEDTEGKWLTQWLGNSVDASLDNPGGAVIVEAPSTSQYKVTAKSGLNIRSGPGTSHSILGCFTYGTTINVKSIDGGWGNIDYSGKEAYVSASYIQAIDGGASSASVSSGGGSGWSVGDAVVATGRPQYTSYGEGRPGNMVTDYHGAVTYLNLRDGVPYPICVGYLGWFAISELVREDDTQPEDDGGETKGLQIQAQIVRENWRCDGGDEILDCGGFELDSASASGPPSVVTIRATALPYTAQVRQTLKSRSWENCTLSGIAGEIASVSGMSCIYEAAHDTAFDRVEQVTQSDIAFLSGLCQWCGISLKATSNALVLFDQQAYESLPSVMTIERADKSYISYKLDTGSTGTDYAYCRVSYIDPGSGKLISGIAYAQGREPKEDDGNSKEPEDGDDVREEQILEIYAKAGSTAEAENLAAKLLRLHNKYEKTAVFSLPGDVGLVAGLTVELTGWGMWDGKYMINQARHSVDAGGYTTQLSLRRVLAGY